MAIMGKMVASIVQVDCHARRFQAIHPLHTFFSICYLFLTMTFISPDDELDPMEDADDELEVAGMHVLGDDVDDEDEEVKTLLATVEVPVEEEAPKDGLAELEEMEKAYLSGEAEDDTEEEDELV